MAAFFVTIILLLPFACYVIRLTLCPFREKKRPLHHNSKTVILFKEGTNLWKRI